MTKLGSRGIVLSRNSVYPQDLIMKKKRDTCTLYKRCVRTSSRRSTGVRIPAGIAPRSLTHREDVEEEEANENDIHQIRH
eukprot:929037-Pelagomonas_calceolata.AAC.3